RQLWEWLKASTAVAVDMESCTIAANGYRYRVPYGTLLSVSDLPLHAVPKLPAQAQAFYSNSKEAHVMCAVRTVEQLAITRSGCIRVSYAGLSVRCPSAKCGVQLSEEL